MTFGAIGKLEIDGRQVGGFRDWQIDVLFYNRTRAEAIAIAGNYWMFEKVEGKLLATFYFSINGELIMANQSLVNPELPKQYTLNKLIQAPLKMVFCGN